MSQINITNLTFHYEGSDENIFENISLQLDTDWKLGLVGRNGKGKTTLLNILLGKYDHSGKITSDTAFRYFPAQIPGNEYDHMTLELMQKAFTDREDWCIMREMGYMDMDTEMLYRPYFTLSPGERTRVMLCCLFAGDNEFMLIDEPTNHLDSQTRGVISDYLSIKRGFIVVSHDRKILDECTDHTLALNRTSIELTRGNFSTWWENRQRQNEFEQNQNDKLGREIKHLTESAKRTAAWADKNESTKIGFDPVKEHDRCIATRSYIGAKTKSAQRRRKNLENRQSAEIEEKRGLLLDVETVDDIKLMPRRYFKDTLVRADGVSISYDGRKVCSDISFEIKNGDRLRLSGMNGCGKSSIIKLILGAEATSDSSIYNGIVPGAPVLDGKLYVGSGLIISYCGQDASMMRGTLPELAEKENIDKTILFAVLRKLGLERKQFDTDIAYFSEGQKKKAALAASLCRSADLYIWDEPMNYIDIFSRMQIEDLILKFKPTMVFVEHDDDFAGKAATATVEMRKK